MLGVSGARFEYRTFRGSCYGFCRTIKGHFIHKLPWPMDCTSCPSFWCTVESVSHSRVFSTWLMEDDRCGTLDWPQPLVTGGSSIHRKTGAFYAHSMCLRCQWDSVPGVGSEWCVEKVRKLSLMFTLLYPLWLRDSEHPRYLSAVNGNRLTVGSSVNYIYRSFNKLCVGWNCCLSQLTSIVLPSDVRVIRDDI